VLFDAVGTLFEPCQPIGATYARFARTHGVDAAQGAVERAFRAAFARSEPRVFPGAPPAAVAARERAWWRSLVAEVFEEAAPGARFDDFDAFFDRLFAYYATGDAWRTRTGVRAVLARLRGARLALGVLSNFDHRLGDVLESLGIAAFFDVVVTPGPHGYEKPDPRLFHVAVAALGRAPGEVLYVGDDPERDVAGARRAGLRALDVTTLASFEDLPARAATLGADLDDLEPGASTR